MSRILKTFFIGLISISSLALYAQTQYHIVVIDQTGSMTATRSATGNSRWEDAIQIAAADLTQFNSFQTLLGRTLSVQVVTFNGSSWTDRTPGFVSYSSALTAINNLSALSPSSVTPLAETLCGMADDLLAVGTGASDRSLSFYTDGGENSSSGPCDGTNGNLGDPAAWKTKVVLKFQTNMVVNITTFDDFVRSSEIDPFLTDNPELALLEAEGVLIDASMLRLNQAEDAFFRFFTSFTGGTYRLILDNDPCTGGGHSGPCP